MTGAASPIRILLLGARGRLGKAVTSLIAEDDDFILQAELTSDATPASLDTSGIDGPLVLIDVSLPGALDAWLPVCREQGIAIVSAVTGLSDQQHADLKAAAADTAVLWGANLSTGIALMSEAIADMGRWKTPQTHAALLDEHHQHKRDRPSGTALTLASAWLSPDARPTRTADQVQWQDQTPEASSGSLDDLAITVRREGEIIGHHRLTIQFGDETLTLDHRVTDRAVYARGALKAARWLAGRRSGYSLFAEMFRNP